jgi:hypothetical protein
MRTHGDFVIPGVRKIAVESPSLPGDFVLFEMAIDPQRHCR